MFILITLVGCTLEKNTNTDGIKDDIIKSNIKINDYKTNLYEWSSS